MKMTTMEETFILITNKELDEMIDWCRKKMPTSKSNPFGLTGNRLEGYEMAFKVFMSYLHSRKEGINR